MRQTTRWVSLGLAAAVAGTLGLTLALQAQPFGDSNTAAEARARREAKKAATIEQARVPVDIARDRARLLHSVYATTLDVMHQRFFERNKSVLPARAMEDIFEEMEQQHNGKAQWISVNTKPMSINHEPATDFEKAAAAELAAGKTEWEAIEKGVYLRATPIPLRGGCVGCHTGFFNTPPTSPRMAGLVISIPIKSN